MKIVIRIVDSDQYANYVVSWPEGWPVPRVGEAIELADGTRLRIQAVDWFPQGGDDVPEPAVYVTAR